MDDEPIEVGGILYHARDGVALTDENGDMVPADICICFAHNEYECVCGAWDRPIQDGRK